jgi:hypothetical protein
MLPYRRAIRAERHEKARGSFMGVSMHVEESKGFILVIVEAPSGGANGSDRRDGKRLR